MLFAICRHWSSSGNSNSDRPDVAQQQVPAYSRMEAYLNQAGEQSKAYYQSTYAELP